MAGDQASGNRALRQTGGRSMRETIAQGSGMAGLAVGNITAPTFMWAGLAGIIQAKPVRNAVLIIMSPGVRGQIGVFCNRYISGAVVQDTNETGMDALRKLLGVRAGIFGFRNILLEESAELKQGLVVDIVELKQLQGESREKFPTPADALEQNYGAKSGDESMIHIVDTDAELGALLSDGSLTGFGNLEYDAGAAPALKETLTNDETAEPEGSVTFFDFLSHQLEGDKAASKLSAILMPALPATPTVAADKPIDALREYERLLHQELNRSEQQLESVKLSENQSAFLDDLRLFNQLLNYERERLSALPVSEEELEEESKDANNGEQSSMFTPDFYAELDLITGRTVPNPAVDHSVKPAAPKLSASIPLPEEAEAAAKKWSKRWKSLAAAAAVAIVAAGVYAYTASQTDATISDGIRQLDANQTTEAIAAFDKAIAADPKSGRAYFHRALAQSKAGHTQDALADLDKALSLGIPEHTVLLARASIEEAQLNYEEALKHCTAVIADDPRNADAYQLRALVNSRQNHYQNAIADFAAALKLTSDKTQRSDLLQGRAYAYAALRDWQNALNDLDEALKLTPSAFAYLQRGDALRQLGQYEKASESYGQALTLNKRSYEALVSRAVCEVKLHRTTEALDDFAAALSANPNGISALVERGDLHASEGKWAKAADDYAMALKIDGSIPPIHKKLDQAKEALRKQGLSMPAVAAANNKGTQSTGVESQSMDWDKLPKDYAGLVHTGYNLLKEGSTEDALECFYRAVKLQPSSYDARKYLAYALGQKHEYQQAIDQMQGLARVDSLLPQDSLMLATWLNETYQNELAIEVLSKVVERNPEFLQAKAKLAKIYIDAGFARKASDLCHQGLSQSRTPAEREMFNELLQSMSQ